MQEFRLDVAAALELAAQAVMPGWTPFANRDYNDAAYAEICSPAAMLAHVAQVRGLVERLDFYENQNDESKHLSLAKRYSMAVRMMSEAKDRVEAAEADRDQQRQRADAAEKRLAGIGVISLGDQAELQKRADEAERRLGEAVVAIKIEHGRNACMPWHAVTDEAVDGFLAFAREAIRARKGGG